MSQQFDLSLVPLSSRNPFHEYQRRLVLNGKETATIVHGDKIDALYHFDSAILLVTSYDYFDGVSYWFSILNCRGRILDRASTPDYFGFIEWLEPPSQSCLKFSFFGTNDIWQVSINSEGAWSFKMSDIARRLNRYIFSRRHMFFSCEKGAPWIFQQESPTNTDVTSASQQSVGSNG
jgi:hypothetical protein